LELNPFDSKSLFGEVPDDLPGLLIACRPKAGLTDRLCAVGDIGLSGRAATTANADGAGRLFAEVAPVVRTAHLCFGNLETPLAEWNRSAQDVCRAREWRFTRTRYARAAFGCNANRDHYGATLRQAGFSILHLANNHVGEYGQAGLITTLAINNLRIVARLWAHSSTSGGHRYPLLGIFRRRIGERRSAGATPRGCFNSLNPHRPDVYGLSKTAT